MLAALSATWTGGSANLVAVKQIDRPAREPVAAGAARGCACVTRCGCCCCCRAGRSRRASIAGRALNRERIRSSTAPTTEPADAGGILLWLGIALFVALGAGMLATSLPASMMLTTTSWTVIIATVAGLIIARTPLARVPGPAPLASALLAMLVAVLAIAEQLRRDGLCTVVHPVRLARAGDSHRLFALAARTFRFDLQLCGISSLAQIGGVASAPVLAATYTPILVPIAVMLAMLGIDPGDRHRASHGDVIVGTGAMKRVVYLIAVVACDACSMRLGSARAADSCTRRHRRDRRASRS